MKTEVFEKRDIIKYETPKNIESAYPSLDLNILKKRSSGKTAPGIVLGYLKKLKEADIPMEYKIILQNIYKDILNLETTEQVRLESWKGKSSFDIRPIPKHKPDRFIITTFQKRDQESQPRQIKKTITREEVNEVLYWINKIKNNIYFCKNCKKIYFVDLTLFPGRCDACLSTEINKTDKIPSRIIGEKAYNKDWDTEIFCKRNIHTKFNLILRLLDFYNIIHYRGGFTTVLKEIKDIQLEL